MCFSVSVRASVCTAVQLCAGVCRDVHTDLQLYELVCACACVCISTMLCVRECARVHNCVYKCASVCTEQCMCVCGAGLLLPTVPVGLGTPPHPLMWGRTPHQCLGGSVLAGGRTPRSPRGQAGAGAGGLIPPQL